ncbi:UDP-glucuronosyltransferase 2B17-like [Photinus pyralis]|nr:UDP-glucuronosyltransferase 2B17-like [Photinus pyralis]
MRAVRDETMLALYVLLCVLVNANVGSGARILGIIPTPSFSHQIVFQEFWKELSLRGHKVTTMTTDPLKDPKLTNLTEIDWHFSYEIWNEGLHEAIEGSSQNPFNLIKMAVSRLQRINHKQLEHAPVQKLIKDRSVQFDLVIVENLMPAMFAFAERFKCPFIGINSFDPPFHVYQALGNPTHPVLYPDSILPFKYPLSLTERIISVLYTLIIPLVPLFLGNHDDQLIAKHFGEGYREIGEISKDVTMLFVNTDPIFHPIRPLVPTVIQVGGGAHRSPPKPLPKELKRILDEATRGFVYFSLGSNVKSKDLSNETRDVIIETFRELPYTVVWKFEASDLQNKPSNVHIQKWLPQQDVLKHPNIKLFITQGGLQSTDEAIYDHVPMVGLPFFADQHRNVEKMAEMGMGLYVEPKNLRKEDLKAAISEVITNPKYKKRIIELAALAQDQPMTGLEKAVWWTEYVIRHKGAKHLRSPLLDIPWYQYLLLDVIGVLLSFFTLLLFILYLILRLILRIVRGVAKLFAKKPKKQKSQ